MLTFDFSGRYDDYKVLGQNVDKATYNLGVEFRPVSQFMLRGRYGTAFKAPTLADEFQGTSGFFEFVTDYYQCAKEGFTGTNVGNCPLASAVQVFGTTSGTPTLKPITAKVLDFGIVVTPVESLDFTADFIRWNISNEIQVQPSDQLLRTEARVPTRGWTSPRRPASKALSQVTRDQFGNLTQISTPKVNVSEEDLNVFVMSLDYTIQAGAAGNFVIEGQYSDTLKHNFTQFAGDTVINDLENPFFNEDFKTKENLSLTWNFRKFGSTVYVERFGATPNYVAYESPSGYAQPPARAAWGTWTLANLSAKYQIIPGLVVSGNIVNLFDKMPPPDNSTPGTVNQPYLNTNYNPYGRSFYVEASYKFGK